MSTFQTNTGLSIRISKRGEATCRVVIGMDENDHLIFCGEVSALILGEEIGFRGRLPICAECYEKRWEKGEPTLEEIRNA
jgi:hypothetical protein